MKTNLNYYVEVLCNDYPEEDFCDYYTYSVDVGLQDIIEYLYTERYGKDYNQLSWYLEDGARELIKDIEDSWWRDDIDVYDMLRDTNLYEFLKEKYKYEVKRIFENEQFNYLKECYADPDEFIFCTDVYCEVE